MTVRIMDSVDIKGSCIVKLSIDGEHLDKEPDGGSDERYVCAYLFPKFMADEEIKSAFQERIGEWEGTRCQHSYDCCAHFYAGPARIVRTNYFAIVEQSYHQNI